MDLYRRRDTLAVYVEPPPHHVFYSFYLFYPSLAGFTVDSLSTHPRY